MLPFSALFCIKLASWFVDAWSVGKFISPVGNIKHTKYAIHTFFLRNRPSNLPERPRCSFKDKKAVSKIINKLYVMVNHNCCSLVFGDKFFDDFGNREPVFNINKSRWFIKCIKVCVLRECKCHSKLLKFSSRQCGNIVFKNL